MAASDGQLQYPEESFGELGGLDVRPNGFFQPQPAQYPQQPVSAFGEYSPWLGGPLPSFEEPGFELGESMARHDGISPYTSCPSTAIGDPADYGLGTGFMFNEPNQPSPENGQSPTRFSHLDKQQIPLQDWQVWTP